MGWIRIEGAAYWCCFVATFLAVAVWESVRPQRQLANGAEQRWTRHGVLMVLSLITVSLLLRASPVAMAAIWVDSRYGLLNRPWLPYSLRIVAAILLLDLAQYWVHRTFHRVPWLWRVHEVHHSDPEYDVSTAARFHPLEALGTQVVILGMVALLAPPVLAVFLAEMLKVVVNLLSHANAAFPAQVDAVVRAVFVTPSVHRIHHSEEIAEQSSNFGQVFPWWDRLFGTYRARPAKEHLVTGLRGFQTSASLALTFMLSEPFQVREPQRGPASDPGPLA